MSNPKASKPDNSAAKARPLPAFDKLYWMRLGSAALGGVIAELIAPDWGTGLSLGIIVYLLTFYVARFTWYKGGDRQVQGKVYTTGIGGFILLFLFTWMLFFTLQMAGY